MFDVNTTDVRTFFADVWKNRFTRTDDMMTNKVLAIIMEHPEYHHYLEHVEDYLDYNWTPEKGMTNPFLHLSLHLSIQEQVSIDQPFGIREIHEKLTAMKGSQKEAEHAMMDALVEMIWKAQRYGNGFDVNEYITNLRKLVGLGQEDNPRKNPHEI